MGTNYQWKCRRPTQSRERPECISLMPGVELRSEPPEIPSLYRDARAILLKGKRIGSVSQSSFSDATWSANICLGVDDTVNIRFQFITGQGKTPFEAIAHSLYKSELDVKKMRESMHLLSRMVIGGGNDFDLARLLADVKEMHRQATPLSCIHLRVLETLSGQPNAGTKEDMATIRSRQIKMRVLK